MALTRPSLQCCGGDVAVGVALFSGGIFDTVSGDDCCRITVALREEGITASSRGDVIVVVEEGLFDFRLSFASSLNTIVDVEFCFIVLCILNGPPVLLLPEESDRLDVGRPKDGCS